MNWELLWNSMLVGVGAAGLAVAMGAAAGLAWVSLPRVGRVALLGGAAVNLALPPFLVVNSWLDLFGATGAWREYLPWSLFSLPGAVVVLGAIYWPVVFFFMCGRSGLITREMVEMEPQAAGWRFVRHVWWPTVVPGVKQASFIVGVLAINNFSVPALLQVKVLPAEMWIQFNTTFDFSRAAILAWPLVLLPVLLLVWMRGRELSWSGFSGGVDGVWMGRWLGGFWRRGSWGVTLVWLGIGLILPLVQLAGSSGTWVELGAAWSAGAGVLWMSAVTALGAAGLAVGLGIVGGKSHAGLWWWLLFAVPGVLMGMGMVWLGNRPGLHWFYDGLVMVMVALGVRHLAIAWTAARVGWLSVDGELSDWAQLHGATRWQRLRHVVGPHLWPQVALGGYVIYLLCLWETEMLVMIAPPGGETAALRVFNLLHYGHNAQVNALCLWLLILGVAPLVLWAAGRGIGSWMRREPARVAVLGVMAAAMQAGCGQRPGGGASGAIFEGVEVIGSRGAGAGEFNKPRSLAVDGRDNLYVVDMTGRVQKFSPEGEYLLAWQMPELERGKPKGMSIDQEGNVVVIEPHYFRVNHFTPEGVLVRQWGNVRRDDGGTALVFPRAAALGLDGSLFVSEYGKVERVQVFDRQGELVRVLGKAGKGRGEFNRPEGLAVDREGRLYVADSCNHRVQVFGGQGDFLYEYGRAGAGVGELSYPYDIAVDAAGREYVCEFGNSRIQVFDEGQSLEIIGGPGAEPGRMSNPWSIALDSKGNLYVADAGNHRVQRFERRGGRLAVRVVGGVL